MLVENFSCRARDKSFYCPTFAGVEKLIRHIESLLIRNDYVIIPGLGGFVLQEQPAQITPEGIVPPRHRVGFNARMDNNDGMLATEVLRTEGIPYRAAIALIRDEVAEAQKALQAGDDVPIGRLGTLRLNQERQITYTPADRLPVFPADFGLGVLHIARPCPKQAPKAVVIPLPSRRSVFRYAASILVLLAVLLCAPRMGDSNPHDMAGNRSRCDRTTSRPNPATARNRLPRQALPHHRVVPGQQDFGRPVLRTATGQALRQCPGIAIRAHQPHRHRVVCRPGHRRALPERIADGQPGICRRMAVHRIRRK